MDSQTYKQIITKQSKDVLVYLLTEFTEKRTAVKADILADLGFLDEETELKKIKQTIRKKFVKI